MKKVMLIVNPYSGKGAAKNALFDVVSAFNSAGYLVTVFTPESENGRSITDIARKYGKEFDIVVSMGGDGTLSDTANGLVNPSHVPILGYIPIGSTNDMANSLSLPSSPFEAATAIINGTPYQMDMGYYDGKYFTYIAAFGAFTSVSYLTSQKLKNTFGHAAYIFEGLAHLPTIKPVHTVVEYDEGTVEGSFVFGCAVNSTSVAGIVKLDPSIVSLNDGLFEVFLVREPLNLVDFGNIIQDVVNQQFNSDNIVLLHTKKVRFTFDSPVAFTRDGENGGTYQDVTFENVHNAIKIVKT